MGLFNFLMFDSPAWPLSAKKRLLLYFIFCEFHMVNVVNIVLEDERIKKSRLVEIMNSTLLKMYQCVFQNLHFIE